MAKPSSRVERDEATRHEACWHDLLLNCCSFTRPTKRYSVPPDVLGALETLFDEPGLHRIEVRYRPLYVRGHLVAIGGWNGSVTRPGRIDTSLSAAAFFSRDAHVLHEYYHVVQQWGREGMTRTGYLLRCVRWEREAADFTRAHLRHYRCLRAEWRREGARTRSESA